MADRSEGPAPPGRQTGRRFKDRKDLAIDLLREALAGLDDDPAAVARAITGLTRLYNPLVDAPVVDLATRDRLMQLVGEGRTAEARAVLEERYRLYAPVDAQPRGLDDVAGT